MVADHIVKQKSYVFVKVAKKQSEVSRTSWYMEYHLLSLQVTPCTCHFGSYT